jgi:copper resistance protein C
MRRYAGRGVMVTLLSVTCLCVASRNSLAHAYPDHADPKVGSTISAAPSIVRIWFDSDLEPLFSSIHVQDQSGKNVDKGDSRVNASDPSLLEVSVPLLHPGTYRVFWDVVARDGHRTTGNFSFTIK